MQIPGNPFPTGPDFLRRPQAGSDRRTSADLQAKANAAGPARPRTVASTLRAAEQPRVPGGALARAQTLEQAVRGLADEGRLPPRGSLIDLKA